MLKILQSGRKAYCELQRTIVQKRYFLSEAYKCEEAWKARLKTPLLQNINSNDLYMTLDYTYTTVGKVSALDIDIFVNSLVQNNQAEELLALLYNLRDSAETTNTLDSTHHAVIRYLLDNDCTTELMNVLHNRLQYGIFPDHLCYNILMDTYIKKSDYASAAKVAVLPMLQEDSENLITNALSLYACHKYLENPDTWQKPPEPVDNDKEEIKVRVSFLKNPFFDDHFDLKDPFDLVGKTLAFQGKALNDTLGRTCQLRGLILYKKYEDVSKLIKHWLNEVDRNIVYDEIFNLIEKDTENISKEEASNELEDLMSQVNMLKQKNLCKSNLIEVLENNVKFAVEKQQDTDINDQVQRYTKWEKQREEILNKQKQEIKRQAKLKEINELKKFLQEKERLITFFDQEEQIELEIEKKEAREKAETERVLKMHGAVSKLKKLEHHEEYIPPKI